MSMDDEDFLSEVGRSPGIRATVERYWALHQEHRDAIIEAHEAEVSELLIAHGVTDERQLEAIVTKAIGGINTHAAPVDDPLLIRTCVACLRIRDGVLISVLFREITPVAPIVPPDLFPWFASASDEELSTLPPVGVWVNGERGAVDYTTNGPLVIPDSGPVAEAFQRFAEASNKAKAADIVQTTIAENGSFEDNLRLPGLNDEPNRLVAAARRAAMQAVWDELCASEVSDALSLPGPGRPAHASPLPRGDFMYPNAPLFRATHRAIVSRNGWSAGDTDFPCFVDQSTKLRFSIDGQPGDGSFDQQMDTDFESALQRLDPEITIVYRAIMAAWMLAYTNNKLPTDQTLEFHVNDVLALRGRSRNNRHRDYKPAQKREIANCLMTLSRIRAHGMLMDKERNIVTLLRNGHILDVAFDEKEDLFGLVPYSFRVRPTVAVQPYYERTSDQAVWFYRRLAHLDVHQGVGRMAYKIGVYLESQWRIRETHDLMQPFKVRTILEGSRIEIEANPKHYVRFKKSVDDAFERLVDIGMFPSCEYVAEDFDRMSKPRGTYYPAKRRGTYHPWLESRVVFTPPQRVLDQAARRREALATRVASQKRRAPRSQRNGSATS